MQLLYCAMQRSPLIPAKREEWKGETGYNLELYVR